MNDPAVQVANSLGPVARPRWRKRLLWGGLVLAVLMAAVGGWFLYDYGINDRALHQAEAEADRLDPGWRFHELEAARAPAPPDPENSALQVRTVHRLLPAGAAGTVSGLLSRLENSPPQVRLDEGQAKQLRAALQPVAAALAQARRLADLPHGRYDVAWDPDLNRTSLSHLEQAREVVNLLRLEAMRQAQDGDADGALASCQAALNAGRSIGDEPIGVSQLFRQVWGRFAALGVERTLAQGEPSPAALEGLQRLLEEEAGQPFSLRAARSIRAFAHEFLKVFREGRLDRRAWGLATPNLIPDWATDWAMNVMDSGKARASHAAYLRYLNELVEITRLPLEQQTPRLEQLGPPQFHLPQLMFALGEADNHKGFRNFQSIHAQLQCAAAAVAVERYRREKRHWPDGWADLVPGFLREVPADPYDGAPLRYGRLGDGVVVYSLGPDRRDDGGSLSRSSPSPLGTDVGFRLWDVKRRAQPAPAAATGEKKLGP